MIKENKTCDMILNEVRETITKNNLILDGDKIIVAVSGGPDSVTLLDVLCNLKDKMNLNFEVIVAHVNHMLREESKDEKIYVQNLCKKYGVEFNYLEVDIKKVAKDLKISEEMAGREKRYEFFRNLKKEKDADKIAIAHNLNDNVETVLLHLLRGSGLKGLTGMKYKSDDIIRPLLNIKKYDILLYTENKKLNPCFDKTNDDTVYLRNKIRNVLIPELESEYNSNIMQNIIRMSKVLAADEDFIEDYVDKVYGESIIKVDKNHIVFNYSNILNEHSAIIFRYVRKLFEKLNLLDGISNVNITDVVDILTKNIKGKRYIKKGKFEIHILKKNVAEIFVEEEL